MKTTNVKQENQQATMVRKKRPYDKEGARHMLRLNRERKAKGLPPLKRKRRKTNRKYTYSGRFVGANGGNRRKFKNQKISNKMIMSQSPFLDATGSSVREKACNYQGKYPKWFCREESSKEKPAVRSMAV
jgi:hypothetical protein